MKVFLIIDETSFYHPSFVSQLIMETNDEIVGAALVTRIPKKNSLKYYLSRRWYFLKFNEILKLIYKSYRSKFLDILTTPSVEMFYSVKSVFNYFKIDYFEVEGDINKKHYLDMMREKKIDVIVSSNSLIFKSELLDIPSICCLNRHSALLPSYGGLWPIFQAYRSGEDYVGVSVHTMNSDIDGGIVLSNQKIPITIGCTIAELYEKCFALSASVLLDSLNKVRINDFSSCDVSKIDKSYYSFPNKEHWAQFRKRNGRFI
jgi:methionyl-tRNA formyltransferase